MDKLKMQTSNIVDENVGFIESRFPNCIVEARDEDGNLTKMVDFDVLKQELSKVVVDGDKERYQMTWPDKRKAILAANLPISKTLRPCFDKSVEFATTKNIYIEGDNLDVLKLLEETYLNKVKLIYIDPPYNAGADLLYKNNYEMSEEEFKSANFDINEDGYLMTMNSDTNGRYHTDWLNMMYSRIKVARDLLTDDGCMVIAIDANELVNIVKLADEIFSEKNRIGIVTVVHKPEGRNQERYFASSNEFAIFYAKNIDDFDFEKVIIDEEIAKRYDKHDEKGGYTLISFIAKNHGREGFDKNLRENNPKKYFPIYVSQDLLIITLDKTDGYYEIYPNTKTQERTWKYIKETCIEKINNNELVALKDPDGNVQLFEKYREDKGQLIKTHWIDKKYNAMVYGTKLLDELMKTKTFDFPKSLYLMEDIVNLTTKKDSLILDFFSGSSTTAHAVMQLNAKDGGNRRFIMIQLPWKCNEDSEAYKSGYFTIPEIAEERIRRAGARIKEEVGLMAQNLDTGFRVFKLDSSNMKDTYYKPSEYDMSLLDSLDENIKPDRTPEDLLFQVMLDLGLMLDSKIESKVVNGKKVFIVGEYNEKVAPDLICCFDSDVDNDTVKEIAQLKPRYAVFRDSSMSSDSVAVNFDQIFETYSPSTTRKVL